MRVLQNCTVYLHHDLLFFLVMVHMTCKRTKNAKEDLAYVVNKFLRAEPFDSNVARSSSDTHTQTVSPDKRHLQVNITLRLFVY